MKTLDDVMLIAGALGQTTFAAWYGLALPWFGSWVGRALFLKSAALALVFDVGAVEIFVDLPDWVNGAELTFVVLAIYLQLVVFVGRARRASMTETLRDAPVI